MSLAGELREAEWERQRAAEKRTGKTGLDARYDSANLPVFASYQDIQAHNAYWNARKAGDSPEAAAKYARYMAGLGSL